MNNRVSRLAMLLLLFTLSNCGGAGLSQEEYDTLMNEKKALDSQVLSLKKDLARKTKDLEVTQERVSKLEAERMVLRKKIIHLDERLSMYRGKEGVAQDDLKFSQLQGLAAEYAKLIDIEILDARWLKKYSQEREPGLRLKIKNRGAQKITKMTLVVYFLNKSDDIIGEASFPVVSIEGKESIKNLKPKYSIIIPRNKTDHLTVPGITDEWSEGRIKTAITELTLSKR